MFTVTVLSKTIGLENMKVKTVHGLSGVRELVCTLGREGKRYLRVYIQIRFRHACHETRDRQSRSLVSGQVCTLIDVFVIYFNQSMPYSTVIGYW